MREVKIRYTSFSVFQFIHVLSFYGSQKGNEGADTDLIFHSCLPNWEKQDPSIQFSICCDKNFHIEQASIIVLTLLLAWLEQY